MRMFIVALLLTSCQQYKDDLLPAEQKPYQHIVRETPKCNDICFNDYRALKGKNNNRDYLAFANFGYRGIGRCRGHAIVNQKVYELTNFKDDTLLNCNTKILSDECKEIIADKLQRLMNGNEVQSFPGFKNLYQLSNHPQVKQILKSYVAGISHRYRAVRAQIRDMDQYDSLFEAIFYEVTYRVKENQRPYIGIQGAKVGHHAVLAHSLEYKNEGEVICVHDSNIIFHDDEDQCQNYIYLQKDSVYYKRHKQEATILYTFSLTSDEDKRVEQYIQARYAHCVASNKANRRCK